MRVGAGDTFELTYCTNIHAAQGWDAVFANLRHYLPAVKARLAPERLFGVGLRLSGQESCELLAGDHLARFHDFLQQQGCYVFTLNGFPYGTFHGEQVKDQVHAPDWRDDERVAYTLRLADILARLLPSGSLGSISTNPLTYRAWLDPQDDSAWKQMTHNLVTVAAHLMRIEREQGKHITLAIELEPDGLLDTGEDVVRYFTEMLLRAGARRLAAMLGVKLSQAREHLLQHICICFDTCHEAVMFAEPATIFDQFASVGIRISKVQISSALKVMLPAGQNERQEIARQLVPFADSIYLHQVVQRNANGTLRRYPDLITALPAIEDMDAREWRVHIHVPLFVESYQMFQATQDVIYTTLDLLKQRQMYPHLEIETYTWSVLPQDLQRELADSIVREYRWVLGALA